MLLGVNQKQTHRQLNSISNIGIISAKMGYKTTLFNLHGIFRVIK